MRIATPKECRQARAFLYTRGISSKTICPESFALTAKTTGMSFSALLRTIKEKSDAGSPRKRQRETAFADA